MRHVIHSTEVPTYVAPSPDRRRFQVFVDRDRTGSANLAAGLVILPPNQAQPDTSQHEATEEVYYVVQGHGLLELGRDTYEVRGGTVIYVPPATSHRMINTDDSEELVWFFANTPPLEDYKPVAEGWTVVAPSADGGGGEST
jgi:mannose-6-phosphate isomerase-like protein (cupin superfamily)